MIQAALRALMVHPACPVTNGVIFPGGSAGWQISEDLFSDINWLEFAQLRASLYGSRE